MNNVFRPVVSLAWMLSQTAELTVYKWYLVVPFVIFAILAVLGFLRRDEGGGRRLWIPVLLLPTIWIGMSLWTFVMWAPHYRDNSWLSYPATAAIGASLVASAFFIAYQKRQRLFVASYSIINLYITCVVSFISVMAVTGNWI